jgi:F-type H+-transporting ATPase subunit c
MISLAFIGVGLGAGLVLVGAGVGIGLIGSSAVSGISRQPEAAGNILVNMVIPAAMIEGAALFALVIFFLMSGNVDKEVLTKGAGASAGATTEQVSH